MKKTAVERALATLVEKGQVIKKEYGKAKIFLLAQDKLDQPNTEDIASSDAKIRELTSEYEQCSQNLSSKREKVASLKSQYTLQDAKKRVESLEDELASKTAKRAQLGDGSMLMSKEEKLAIDKSYFDLRSLWKKYKALAASVLDQISEGTGKRKEELREEIGIETDEDVNVNLTDFVEVANPKTTRKGGPLPHSTNKRLKQADDSN